MQSELKELFCATNIYDGHKHTYAIKASDLKEGFFLLRLYIYREENDEDSLACIGKCAVDSESKLRRIIQVHGNLPNLVRRAAISQLEQMSVPELMEQVFLPYLRSEDLVVKKKKGELAIGFYTSPKKQPQQQEAPRWNLKVVFEKSTREEPIFVEHMLSIWRDLRTRPIRCDFFFEQDCPDRVPLILGRMHFLPYGLLDDPVAQSWLESKEQLQEVWRNDIPCAWHFAVKESGTYTFRDFQFRNGTSAIQQFSCATTEVFLVTEDTQGRVQLQLSTHGAGSVCIFLEAGTVLRLGPCLRQTKYRHRDLNTSICFPSHEFTESLTDLCEDIYALEGYEIRGLSSFSVEKTNSVAFTVL